MIADEEKIKIDDKTLTIIAKKADGALRDAESYFDQVVAFSKGKIDAELVSQMLNLIDEEIFFKISDAVIEKDYRVVFQTSEKIYENGWDFSDFLDGLIEHFRNILSVTVTDSTNTIETADIYKTRYLENKGKFTESDVLRLLNFLNKSQQELRYSQNQKLKIEIILSHLIALESSKSISELISEVASDNPVANKITEPASGFYKPAEPVKKKVDSTAATIKKTESQEVKPLTTIVSPSLQPNFSFDDVVKKWEYFIDSINTEKGLTLGPALQGFNLISLKDNNLYFSAEKDEDLNTFRLNEKYLTKKSEEYFGRRFNFMVSNNRTARSEDKKSTGPNDSKEKNFADPYEDIILNQLGGEKIA
jgi:DNA polymerase-3 subunit gamma/tau